MATKISPRAMRRHATGSDELGRDQLVIHLPDPRLLRIVARSVFLAAALLSFPWLRAAILAPAVAPAADVGRSRWIDDPFFLPMLLRDLRRQGLLRHADRAVFLGDASARLAVLRQNNVDPIAEYQKPGIPDRTVDFVLAADGLDDACFGFIDRVLRTGGITVIRLSSDPSQPFYRPPNYRIAYIRRFGSTVVAIKKMAHSADANADESVALARKTSRRLLSLSAARRAALDGLEDVLLEPPMEAGLQSQTRYLPELMGDLLSGYSRRVFVDVVPPGAAGSSEWFEKQYPTGGKEFEMVSLGLVKGAVAGGVAEWLARNVREEEYVVMKAEADVVEEVMAGGAVGLVDELFLECENQGQKARRSKRAYWECLALYGRLRDEGVAVHQWWG